MRKYGQCLQKEITQDSFETKHGLVKIYDTMDSIMSLKACKLLELTK